VQPRFGLFGESTRVSSWNNAGGPEAGCGERYFTQEDIGMALEEHVPSIANVIQLTIAPVFMLTAIGAFLNVMTGRLARAVDRARELERAIGSLQAESLQFAKDELHVISRRARWTNRAITCSTVCALLICFEIATLFGGEFLAVDVSLAAGWLFVLALVALIIGLLAFLREIFLATRYLKIGTHRPGF
jgi:hypothetical protein